jgi:hypothetical protein
MLPSWCNLLLAVVVGAVLSELAVVHLLDGTSFWMRAGQAALATGRMSLGPAHVQFEHNLTSATSLPYERDASSVFAAPLRQGLSNATRPALPPPLAREGNRIRPDFFILGTRKGGTTSFHSYLTKHPRIYPFRMNGTPKDGEAFGQLGSAGYQKLFDDVPADQLVGDSTVSRLMDNIEGLKKYSDRKMFVLLRDPVERCHSQMLMRSRLHSTGMNQLSNMTAIISKHADRFEDFLQHLPLHPVMTNPEQGFRSAENCLYEGAYVAHLRRLFAAGVPKKNVKIYFSEDFFRNTEKTMDDAFKFLGLEPQLIDTAQFRQVYNGRSQDAPLPSNLKLSDSLRRRILSLLEPYNRELEIMVNTSLPWYSTPVGISRHQRNASLIPSHIFIYWDQGWENAPRWQQTCLWTWRYFNPDYTVYALDHNSIEKLSDRNMWIPGSTFRRLKIAAKSDVFRVLLLAKYGGIWVDSSVACNKPLSSHLDRSLDFVSFRRDDRASKNIRMGFNSRLISPWITSWFMGGPVNSYALRQIRNCVVKFWATPTFPYDYFWLHELVADLAESDITFSKQLNAARLPSGDGAHCFTGNLTQQSMFKRCNKDAVYSMEKNSKAAEEKAGGGVPSQEHP